MINTTFTTYNAAESSPSNSKCSNALKDRLWVQWDGSSPELDNLLTCLHSLLSAVWGLLVTDTLLIATIGTVGSGIVGLGTKGSGAGPGTTVNATGVPNCTWGTLGSVGIAWAAKISGWSWSWYAATGVMAWFGSLSIGSFTEKACETLGPSVGLGWLHDMGSETFLDRLWLRFTNWQYPRTCKKMYLCLP